LTADLVGKNIVWERYTVSYSRPWKSFPEQLELLKSRGILVADEDAALRYLETLGYYRLSAYFNPFRTYNLKQDPKTGIIQTIRQETFQKNTYFEDAVNLYQFDKNLRALILDAVERIEIAARVDIAHLLGERNTFAYLDKSEFHPTFSSKINQTTGKSNFDTWQEKHSSLISRSKEDFVLHYRRTHGSNLPIWVAIEIWDFGAMSQLFSMMNANDQKCVAAKYGIQEFKVFGSWLRSLNYLRNLAAHHSRIWNRNVIDQPKLPSSGNINWCDGFIGKNDLIAKPFLLLAITNHILKTICPKTTWNSRVKELIKDFPSLKAETKVSVDDIGLIEGWDSWW
jgi:abortive infection bacteriophage resistance protein